MSEGIRLSGCHCVNLRRSSQLLTEYYSRLLEPSGLSLPQFSLLKNIAALSACSTAELARRVRLEHSTLVRNLHLLAGQGLITDRKEPGRKRSVWQITAEGRKALETGIPLWETAQKDVESALGEAGLCKLNELLVKIQTLGGNR